MKEHEIWSREGPVHPHNQVIVATHRTLITTINDSLILSPTGLFAPPPPRGRVSLTYRRFFFLCHRVADSSVRTRLTFPRFTVIGINDSTRGGVPLLSPLDRPAKSTFARSTRSFIRSGGFRGETEPTMTPRNDQTDKLINRGTARFSVARKRVSARCFIS